jgi:hypothetical protein
LYAGETAAVIVLGNDSKAMLFLLQKLFQIKHSIKERKCKFLQINYRGGVTVENRVSAFDSITASVE